MMSEGESWQRHEVAVLGSGVIVEGDPRWTQAYQLGRLLAQEGFAAVTGGYTGLMEATSRGAHEAGGRVIGLPMRPWTAVQPNPWITEARWSESLGERVEHILLCEAVVVLPGGIGTLSEMAMSWVALHTGKRALIFLGDCWPPVIQAMSEHLLITEPALACLSFAASPEDV